MSFVRTICFRLLILLVFIQTNYFSFSQIGSYPIDDWVKKLGAKRAHVFSGLDEILSALKSKDSAECAHLFNELEKKGSITNNYFIARFDLTKAVWLHDYPARKLVRELTSKALSAAYETDNDSLVSGISWWSGLMMYYAGEIELASMYCLNAAEIDERIRRKISSGNYDLLSIVLYATRDNEKCIYYAKKAIEIETDTSYSNRHSIMSQLNTIGLCWKRIGNYDSAFFYLDMALRQSIVLGEKIWQSIISGNIGQVYYSQQKYDLAKSLLEADYRFSKNYGEFGSASNSLQWVARINLAQGKKDSALMQVREAFQLLAKDPNPNYLQNICYATADIYRAFGNNDSAYKYSQLYNHLHDSIERTVADSRLEISRIRLDNIQNVLTIKNLNKERQAEKLKRNFILAAIILCSIIAILIINGQRVKSFHKQQLAIQQKLAAEAEVNAAKEQLEMFRQNVVEKTDLIEQLQQRMQHNQDTAEQSQIVTELSRQTILTEEDW
ncbi:MAG TPA: hypothetical protein VGG71_14625, partial [Chitinophagaceae bacterium]